MTANEKVNGSCYAQMISAGAANLREHAQEVNNLNVFPIPDGDTGENMLLTMLGGAEAKTAETDSICEAAERISNGMLLAARGNSGVILSQFFDGISSGFSDTHEADVRDFCEAFKLGVKKAYDAVMTPTEGTILTVIREATDYACSQDPKNPSDFLDAFICEAQKSLERTPSLLPVLQKAGVVDSGGAGLVYIIDGMRRALSGEAISFTPVAEKSSEKLDLDAFGTESVLEFGYCTELLVRLQSAKTDIEHFDTSVITDYLGTIGNSIVAVKNGSIVKIHVHTMTPHKVLAFCQTFGEFLKVKIENMSLQHNNTVEMQQSGAEKTEKERKPYGVVAVASGDGIKQLFIDSGADVIVDGGQSNNPSAEDFIEAFDKTCADVIFVLPNNGNVILAAKQAASMYKGSDVRVIESKTVGDGYAALSMLDTDSMDTDSIANDLAYAMDGVVTAEISRCIRDINTDELSLSVGDYIGFVGKELIAKSADRLEAVCGTLNGLNFSKYDICIIIYGKNASADEVSRIEEHIANNYVGKEVYIINGMQDIYDYILILE